MKSKIEIAPTSENLLTYDEAMMYCFVLSFNGKDGWRMPTYMEFIVYELGLTWHLHSPYRGPYKVTPVRDLKDNETKN